MNNVFNFLFIFLITTSLAHRQAEVVDLTSNDYAGYRAMSGSICLGGSSRLITPSYLTGYRYSDCCNACRGNYNCAGFAVRPSDGVCYAISSGCTLRDDEDWVFYRRVGSGPIQVDAPTTPGWLMPMLVAYPDRPTPATPTTTEIAKIVDMRYVSFPEFTYVGSHCQGMPLGGREFESAESCRAYCLSMPLCFGFSLRFDGICMAKTSECQWISDVQWSFYLRTYRAVYIPLPQTTTTTLAPRTRPQPPTTKRPLVLVQLVPISEAQSVGGWAAGWPTFNDFYLMNGHCQGGALQEDYLYSASSCRRACLANPDCFGFSMRSDGLCLPKSKGCTWTHYPVDDWKFYKLQLSPDDDLKPYVALIEQSDDTDNLPPPSCAPPTKLCGSGCAHASSPCGAPDLPPACAPPSKPCGSTCAHPHHHHYHRCDNV